MPLNSLVAEVRRSPVQLKQFKYHAPAPRFIDGDKAARDIEEQMQEQATRQSDDWRDCRYMKELSNTYYCNHFMSKCACEKCNGKLPFLGEKRRR